MAKQPRKSIQERFDEYHAANPEIYNLIVKQFKRALKAGRKRIGIKMIVEWIRFEIFIQTTEPNPLIKGKDQDAYKINNDYSSRYARKLVKDYPEFEKFIELRELKS